MTAEILLLFLIILAMITVMAKEVLPADTLSVTIMVILILGGFVSVTEGLSGLSNPATVTILALMILTVGLETTGFISFMASKLKNLLVGGEWKILSLIMVLVGVCSAFIATTAVVIVFLRILLQLAKKLPVSLSRLLLPLSFAGIMGGSCSLIGTSTNLIVGAMAEEAGLKAFSIFEFSHLGAVFFMAGALYLLLIGRHLLPERKVGNQNLSSAYGVDNFLLEIEILEQSDLIGQQIIETPFHQSEDLDLVKITRKGRTFFPRKSSTLLSGDILTVKGDLEDLIVLQENNGLNIVPLNDESIAKGLNTEEMVIIEVIVKSSSRLVGKALSKINLKWNYSAVVLGVKKRSNYHASDLSKLRLNAGDTLLLQVEKANFENFYNHPEFVVLQEHEEFSVNTRKRYISAGILAGSILLAAINILPILQATLLGCVLMFLTGCLTLQRAYRRIEWNVYFLLAGVIPLGIAMENTGASNLIAQTFVDFLDGVGPSIIIGAIYLATNLLSSVISNNATAILFVPIALSIANQIGVDPRPLLLTIMFAANFSFITPIGYQTNTLVYSVGDYRFTDFFKVGGVLTVLMLILSVTLIPRFFPF